VAHNVIYTTASQVAAIRVDANDTTRGIVIRNNVLRGENRSVLLEGARAKEVVSRGNEGQDTRD
jgi:hypothetical protein